MLVKPFKTCYCRDHITFLCPIIPVLTVLYQHQTAFRGYIEMCERLSHETSLTDHTALNL